MPSGADKAEKLLTGYFNAQRWGQTFMQIPWKSKESAQAEWKPQLFCCVLSHWSCVVRIPHHRWNEDSKQLYHMGMPPPTEWKTDIPVCPFAEISDLPFGTLRDWTGSTGRISSELRESNKRSHTSQGLFFFFWKAALNQYTGDNSLEQDELEEGLFW